MTRRMGWIGLALWGTMLGASTAWAQVDTPAQAQAWGRARDAVRVQPDGLYICEAEEFQVARPTPEAPGWQAYRFGQNYYAATFANSFLSRKAFLGAPPQLKETIATCEVEIKDAGQYLALVRYEAAYRFETRFQVEIEQQGKVVFRRQYGARDNLKIWAFSEKLKTEVGWSWGAVENIVWEGHDTRVALAPGHATLRLIASEQPEPAAKRNIDLVMLTTDAEQVNRRIEQESYLPLDGMLTQSGDVFLRVSNLGGTPLTFTGKGAPAGGNWQQHSPYWVHMRNWQVPTIEVAAGATSEWTEVGGTMDSLADGQWYWTGNGSYKAEFGLRNAQGQIEPLAEFTGSGDLNLAADADTRYRKRLRRQEDVLYDLLKDLKQANPAPHGKPLQRTIVYASTFESLGSETHAAAVREFKTMFSLSDTLPEAPGGRGYIDVRDMPLEKLAEYCQQLGANAGNIAVVSLGDEIGLPTPGGSDVDNQFRAWLQQQGITAADVLPGGSARLEDLVYSPQDASKQSAPGLFYWSKRYQYHYGIQAIKQRTDILRQHLPNAAIGANFSPHYPQEHMFLGEVFKWVTVFRESGMTLPWSEDYIWQVPVGTPQMNNINFDLFRAANRHHPDRKIMYYVMPHMPNNTPNQWRRLFYSALGHGMKTINLFEFRPVHVAYTENHVDEPEMYRMILGSFRELGLFEDIVQDGQIREAQVALWFSETGDIWGDNHGSFAAGKRALYTAIGHQQIPLDFVVEADAIDGTLGRYKVLYLTDAHVSQKASEAIAKWVRSGGRLFVTAGAGMWDELNRPNRTLRDLMGIEPGEVEQPQDSRITWIKQDVPFARVIDTVKPEEGVKGEGDAATNQATEMKVIGVRSRFQPSADSVVLARFSQGEPAVIERQVEQGRITYSGFLPGLSYYQPAIPMRPVDRGSTDDAMIHFLPTEFNPFAARLIAAPADNAIERPVVCDHPMVESQWIRSPHGQALVLVNWTGEPIESLKVTVKESLPMNQISLASGHPVQVSTGPEGQVFTLRLDVADALIVR